MFMFFFEYVYIMFAVTVLIQIATLHVIYNLNTRWGHKAKNALVTFWQK